MIFKIMNDFYPDELEIQTKNEDSCKALFLDPSREVHDIKFITELFDKKDAFTCHITYLLPFISYALFGKQYTNKNVLCFNQF